MKALPINFNKSIILTGTEPQILYTPTYGNGYITDLHLRAKCPSLAQFNPPAPSNSILSREDRNRELETYAQTMPYFSLSISLDCGDGQGLIQRLGYPIWNKWPETRRPLARFLTESAQLLVAKNTQIICAIESSPEYGILPTIQDSISLFVAGFELPSGIDIIDHPITYSLTLTNSATEYSLQFPDNANRYSFKCRGGKEDFIADLKYAFSPGVVTSANGWDILPKNNEAHDNNLNLTGQSLYLAHNAPNPIAVIIRNWI